MSIKIGINGFGRIGRNFFRRFYNDPAVEIVAFNDITDNKTLAHLLKYDSVLGPFGQEVSYDDENIIVNGKKFKAMAIRDPRELPWGELGVEYVVESTGIFRDKETASYHLEAGAKKVIISAPAKNEDLTVVLGVNETEYKPAEHHVISNASCTTNCLAPVAKVLNDKLKITGGLMTTIHSYTNDQNVLDLPHKDLRRARAAAVSMIPTTTGAAKAVALVIPDLKGKMNGFAVRVPTPNVSVVDLVVNVEKSTTVEEVNAMIKEAAAASNGVIEYVEDDRVSVDFMHNSHSSCFDSKMTHMMGDKMIKILTWYDNEWAYSVRLGDLIKYMDAQK